MKVLVGIIFLVLALPLVFVEWLARQFVKSCFLIECLPGQSLSQALIILLITSSLLILFMPPEKLTVKTSYILLITSMIPVLIIAMCFFVGLTEYSNLNQPERGTFHLFIGLSFAASLICVLSVNSFKND